MTTSQTLNRVAVAERPRTLNLNGRGITAATAALTLPLLPAVQAFADGTPSSNGIGQQMQNMAQEGSSTGGIVGSSGMYIAALICFLGGAWALWQSRQPQNREGGKVAMGVAGLVLCGLFATGGDWINKATNTATGQDATITDQSSAVKFGQ